MFLIALALDLSPEDQSEIWQTTPKVSPNIVALRTSYKVLSCWHLVPRR